MKFKQRSEAHARLAENVPNGTASWGNPCETLRCRDNAVCFFGGREVCDGHYHALIHERDHGPDARAYEKQLLDEQRLEIAREEGMLHGVDAYNDAMGWGSSEPYEDEP